MMQFGTSSQQNESVHSAIWESVSDYFLSLFSLLMLSPIILLISVVIKLSSSGPIIFKQKRVGRNGEVFLIYKFRTMHVNAPTSGHESHTSALIRSNSPMRKLDSSGDSRLIPVGKLLRASGLDELPQLVNVLKREMSVVGPRPCLHSEFIEHTEREKRRFHALPGITGLWQVSGKNSLTFEQMIECDLEYVEKKNLWKYWWIVLKTPFVLVNQIIESRRHSNLVKMPEAAVSSLEKEAVGQ